ncbi:MAG: pirin family protein [Gammaproteobacteria bacterium]|nr:pirin family protein [Gammaproteobacteria bacterium]
MPACRIERLVPAIAVSEGAGVTVHRTIGTPALRNLDPFLMLDHFNSDDPDAYIAGFPSHPHRGFVTVTYMLNGHMLHQDSMGNRGDLRAGGAQWMKAASGIIHSEMPQQSDGLMRGFQLWINLPAREKMSDPDYQEISPEGIPMHTSAGIEVRIIAGEYQGIRGPVNDPNTQALYFDIALTKGRTFSTAVNPNMRGFVYVFEGAAALDTQTLPQHQLAIVDGGDSLTMTAPDQDARCILVMGLPLGEPIVQYGPFVMNTRAEIEIAMHDFQIGKLVQKKAQFAEK